MELVKFLEKNQRLYNQFKVITLKMTSCRTMSIKAKNEKIESPRFYGQKNSFFGTLPFSPWTFLSMWLHIGALKKIQEKRIYNLF
jgi:hypothetical protein